MPCYFPLKGWRAARLNSQGNRPIVFNRSFAYADLPVTVPCGQCMGCRLSRSRQWAIRCVHEAQAHAENCFITLTYSDDNIPDDRSLRVRDFQLFLKRLRRNTANRIRFYHCGEYGELYGRPHYHALIFGHDFPDKLLWNTSNNLPLYRSATLEQLWTMGYSSIGEVTFQSAAYVARYLLKKITGDPAQEHYEYVNPETGEVTQRKPEYTTMSRRPGIGRAWLDKYLSDVYPDDFIVIKGVKMPVPRYYDTQYEVRYPSDYLATKRERKREALLHVDNNTPERLQVRQSVQKSQLKLLPRKVE